MRKNLNTIRSFPIWIIIFLIILIPINLSFKDLTTIDLDGYSRNLYENVGYLFTLPISFFFVIPFIFLGIINFNKDFEIFLFIIFCSLSFICVLVIGGVQELLLIIKILISIFTLLGFEIYFKKKFLHSENKNMLKIIENSNRKIALMFLVVFIISIISPFYLDNNYNWLLNEIVIYDFLQYYPMVFILLLGVLATNKQRYIILVIYTLFFNLYFWGDNVTLLALLIVFGIYYFLSMLLSRQKNSLVFLSKVFISILFFFNIAYQIFIIMIDLGLINIDLGKLMERRIILVSDFYSKVNIFEFFTPIRFSTDIISKYYHNEFVVLTSAVGVMGSFLFYFILFKRIWYICDYYPEISIAISLVCVLSGVVVTFNLHPYSFIISSFIISYYYILSKFQSQK
jgi:hypothetical protein